MSYDGRMAAADRHVNVNDRVHGIHRMDAGFRIEHLRQQYTEIFHRVREGFDGHHGQNRFRERFEQEGVKISTLRKMFDGYPEIREREDLGGHQVGVVGENLEFERREFPAEYIGLSDFRLCDVQDEDGVNHVLLDPGTYYKHRLSAEEDGTWGIVIDLVRVESQLIEILSASPASVYVPRNELFGALFMFNLFHEHFHYLTELAAMKLSGVENRFSLYNQYLNKAKWGDYQCDLRDCCKVRRMDVRKFLAADICNDIGCEYGALAKSTIGYQYPVEEAMANAHAVKCLKKMIPLYDGFNEIFPFIKNFIGAKMPLGYAEFDCFRWPHRFHLGERIMTRLMRGDVSMPDVNRLQWELIEGTHYKTVEKMEEGMFDGYCFPMENAYTSPIVPDDMAEVPVYMLNCDEFPEWEKYIDKYLC